MKMERSDELAMFRTALDVADLHPDAVALPRDHQVIVGAMRFHYLDWGGSGVPILFPARRRYQRAYVGLRRA